MLKVLIYAKVLKKSCYSIPLIRTCQLPNNIGERLLQTGCIYLSTSICNNLKRMLCVYYYHIKEKQLFKN